MNESFTLEFQKSGRTLPVANFDETEGIVFGNDQGAWPLTLGIGLKAAAAGTEMRLRWVMQDRGWLADRIFRLNATLEDGRLHFTGVDPKALPAGRYRLRVEVKGVPLDTPDIEMDLKDGQDTLVTAQVRPDRRRFAFDDTLINPGDISQKVLMADGSILDEQPVMKWLRDDRPRAARKACLLNVLAKLRMEPSARECLCDDVRSVFFADVDRIYVSAGEGFQARLAAIPGVHKEGRPGHPTHKRLLRKINNPAAQAYGLQSFRLGELNSLQIVVATPPQGVTDRTEYADIDIDLGNPLASLMGLVVHIGELFDPNQTDHFSIYERFSKSGLREFLYYKLEDVAAAGADS
jgi:hypothetical protein